MKKKCLLALLLACTVLCLCSCKQNPTEEELFGKLIAHFTDRGFNCSLEMMAEDRPAPIYHASVWRSLKLDDEEVLVYFDESNRADYLSSFVDESRWGCVKPFGLRFVLVYSGTNAALLEALDAI